MRDFNDGGPAFPGQWYDFQPCTGDQVVREQWSGMTLRDAMAMSVRLPDGYSAKWGEALIGEQHPNDVEPVSVHIDWWMRVEAAYRYRMADAMLAERERTKETTHD